MKDKLTLLQIKIFFMKLQEKTLNLISKKRKIHITLSNSSEKSLCLLIQIIKDKKSKIREDNGIIKTDFFTKLRRIEF